MEIYSFAFSQVWGNILRGTMSFLQLYMNTIKRDETQKNPRNPRVLEVFNALQANSKTTIDDSLLKYAELIVENYDVHIALTEAKKQLDLLELKLVALSWEKPNDILKAAVSEHDLQVRVSEIEGRIKKAYPALAIGEAINGWAMMSSHLVNAVTQLTTANNENAELATQLESAQRGILTSPAVTSVITNIDPSFQFGTTSSRIKFLADDFSKIPGLTLGMAVDRWAAFSLHASELQLELDRYKEDSKNKSFAANVNAENALNLFDEKVIVHKTRRATAIKGVLAKKKKTNAVNDWCNKNRKKYPHYFAVNIAQSILVNEPVMKIRKIATLAKFVKKWERANNFMRR